MKVLITGAAGYIGSVLSRLLLTQGYEVHGLDSLLHGSESLLSVLGEERFTFARADIRDEHALRTSLIGVDAVVHLAAIVGDPACREQPNLARSINVDGSLQLLELSRELGVKRFVFASTCSNYGQASNPLDHVTEDSELHPVSLYTETKVAMERAMLGSPPHDRFAPCVLRLATVFGISPRMRFDLIVNQFTLELLTKRKLSVFGEDFWRPHVHVRDVARAIAAILDAPTHKVKQRVYNVGDSSQNYQKRAIVELIRSTFAKDAEIEYIRAAEDPRNYRVAFERISCELGFKISRTVPDGIREVAYAVREGVFTALNNSAFEVKGSR